MLTNVDVFGVQAIPQLTLPLFNAGQEPIQIKGIEGLGPVRATIETASYGGIVPGEAVTGTSVSKRNIVLTLGLNPTWPTQTIEELRTLLYAYFMPESPVTLRFTATHIPLCQIAGVVEGMEPSIFSKDPEIQVSIICGRPEFISTVETVLTGTVDAIDVPISYIGTAKTGMIVKVTPSATRGAYTGSIHIHTNDVVHRHFEVTNISVDQNNHFEMSSVPGSKHVLSVDPNDVLIANRLGNVVAGSVWPYLTPGDTNFQVSAALPGQDWEMRYFERFGGL